MIQVIIPVYNGFELLQKAVIAVRQNTHVDYELIIADDHSPDSRVLKWCKKEKIKVVQNGSGTQGFPHNCNWAAKQSDSEFICLLNSDTEVMSGWLGAMKDEMYEPSVGIVGAKLIYPMEKGTPWGGTIQHAGVARNGRGMPYHIYRGLSPRARCVNVPTECNAVTFACVLIRRQLWNELGGLDERYVGGQFEDVDFCLFPHEQVATPSGVQNIDSIDIGDLVLGANGEPRVVRNTMQREYNGDMVTISRTYGDDITMTANHPVLTKDGWKRADALSTADMVWCPGLSYESGPRTIDLGQYVDGKWRIRDGLFCLKGQHENTRAKNCPQSVSLSPDLMRVFGYYIAEGSASGNNLQFSFNENRLDLIDDCRETMLSVFSAEPYEEISNGCHRLTYSSKVLVGAFSGLMGRGAANKHLPTETLFATREERKHLLAALWHCDGHISSKAVYSTMSPHLAMQVPMLAANLGLVVGPHRGNNRAHQLWLSNVQLDDLRVLLGYASQNRRKSKYHKMRFEVGDNGIWVSVKKVSTSRRKATVHNISVDGQAYIVGNFVVHNCWRSRERGWRVIYTPRAAAFHLEHGAGVEFVLQTEKKNAALLLERFGKLPSDEHLFQGDSLKPLWDKIDDMAALCHYWRGQHIKWVADRERAPDNLGHCRRLAALPFKDLPEVEKEYARAMARNILRNQGKMLG